MRKLILIFTFVFISLTMKAQTSLVAHAGADRELCYGSSTTLGASQVATGGTSPYSYNWTPNICLSNNAIAHPHANPLVTTTYVLKVTDANNNSANDTIVIKIFDITLYAHAETDISKCQFTELIGGDSLSATGGNAPYEYLWTNNSGDTVAAIDRPSLFVDTTRTFYLRVIDNQGCIARDSFHLIVNTPVHAVGLTDTTLHLRESVTLLDTVLGGTGYFSYEWSPNRWLDDTTQKNPVCTPLSSQQYKLVVTDSRGCTDVTFATIKYEPIDFGQLSSYAAFAVDSITAGDSMFVIGNIGAGFIDTTYMRIYGERHTDGEEIGNLSGALDGIIATLNEMEGETISAEIENATINSGVYFISGDASFNQNLTLHGNDSSLFVFNISGDLIIGDIAHLILDGVTNDKVIFNIGGSLRIGENPELYGSYLVGERVVGGGFNGSINVFSAISISNASKGQNFRSTGPDNSGHDCSSSPVLPLFPVGFQPNPNTWKVVFDEEFWDPSLDIIGTYDATHYTDMLHKWHEWGGWGDLGINYFSLTGVSNYVYGNDQLDLKSLRLGTPTPPFPAAPYTYSYPCLDQNGQPQTCYATATFSDIYVLTNANFYHGYFEIKAKVPAGLGMWPSFWMIRGDCGDYREIDWFDWSMTKKQIGLGILNKNSNNNCAGSGYDIGGFPCPLNHTTLDNENMSHGYHIYAGEWDATDIKYYVDGVLLATIPASALNNDARMQLVLGMNANPSGTFGVDVNSGTGLNGDDNEFLIDYVKVWQKTTDIFDWYFVDGCTKEKYAPIEFETSNSQSSVTANSNHIETTYLPDATYNWVSTSSHLIIDPDTYCLNHDCGNGNGAVCYFHVNLAGDYTIKEEVTTNNGIQYTRYIPIHAISPITLTTPTVTIQTAANNPCASVFCASNITPPTGYFIQWRFTVNGNVGSWGNLMPNNCDEEDVFSFGGTVLYVTAEARVVYYDLCHTSGIGSLSTNIGNGPIGSGCPQYQRTGASSGSLEENTLAVYPSPSDGNLFIQNNSDSKILISLFNVDGIKLTTLELNGNEIKQLTSLPEGIIILEAVNEDDKAVIERKLITVIR